MPESIQNRCYRVIEREFEVDAKSLSNKTDMSVAWGMDDLDVVQLTQALENEFGLVLDEYEIEASITVGDVVRLIDIKLSETHSKDLNGR